MKNISGFDDSANGALGDDVLSAIEKTELEERVDFFLVSRDGNDLVIASKLRVPIRTVWMAIAALVGVIFALLKLDPTIAQKVLNNF